MKGKQEEKQRTKEEFEKNKKKEYYKREYNKYPLRIIILGPQGSGKGTQAELIKEHYNLLHIDMGSELRKIKQKNDELGRKVKELIDKGNLVPDEITLKIFEKKLLELKKNNFKGIISDGFPRNEKQLYLLDEVLGKKFFNIALYIKISDEEAVRRTSKRRICKCKNGEKIEEKIITIEKKEECIKKGCEVIHREDDKEEAIKHRLELYHKKTELLIRDFYDRNILIEINGEQTIKKVFEEIKNKIEYKIKNNIKR